MSVTTITKPEPSCQVPQHKTTNRPPFPEKKPLTFRGWLLLNLHRIDPIGALARDVRRDPEFPEGKAAEEAYLIAYKAMRKAYSEARYEYQIYHDYQTLARPADAV